MNHDQWLGTLLAVAGLLAVLCVICCIWLRVEISRHAATEQARKDWAAQHEKRDIELHDLRIAVPRWMCSGGALRDKEFRVMSGIRRFVYDTGASDETYVFRQGRYYLESVQLHPIDAQNEKDRNESKSVSDQA